MRPPGCGDGRRAGYEPPQHGRWGSRAGRAAGQSSGRSTVVSERSAAVITQKLLLAPPISGKKAAALLQGQFVGNGILGQQVAPIAPGVAGQGGEHLLGPELQRGRAAVDDPAQREAVRAGRALVGRGRGLTPSTPRYDAG